MISPPTLDFDRLTRPIEGANPAGEDLRADPSPVSLYYQVKDARAAARAAERAGTQFEKGQQVMSDEWRKVLRLAPEILATKAKDLEIVAWFTEALLRAHGFAGLRDGFQLLKQLVETFWDGLYPLPDEDGIPSRVAPLAGLSGGDSEGTLAVPIALTAITGDGDAGVFSLWRLGRARELAKVSDPVAVKSAMDSGVATMEQFEAAVRSTDANFLKCLAGDVTAALQHWIALTEVLDARCGSDAPPSSSLRGILEEAEQTILHVVRQVAGIALDDGAPETPVEGEDAGAEAASGRASAGDASGVIRTRDDAFRILTKVADYFRAAEPHSPIASVLDQAVRWGRLPLHQLIAELIPDAQAREHFGMLTGLRGKIVPAEGGE